MAWKRMDPNRCEKQTRDPVRRGPVGVRPAMKGRCVRAKGHKGECSLFKDESPKTEGKQG